MDNFGSKIINTVNAIAPQTSKLSQVEDYYLFFKTPGEWAGWQCEYRETRIRKRDLNNHGGALLLTAEQQ